MLDTSCLAAYFGAEPTSSLAAAVVDGLVRSGRNSAVVSAVSVTELLVRPLRSGAGDVERSILAFLRTFPNLEVVPIDLTVSRLAAVVRARFGLKTPDALIVACGFDRSVGIALSDDAGWPEQLSLEAATMRVMALRAFV
ncbi:MAG TPA: type II toxin-antitoxin system VapC family toxin [Candidatus Limnocylindria bacterium]|nr:type II toxin-antitoxin system VapC family toxin [Candidatus Limnocylindria bacterium]